MDPSVLEEPLPTDNNRFTEFELISLYSANLCMKICDGVNADNYDAPLKNLKIVVDAGNGAGGFFVKEVLDELGADTTGKLTSWSLTVHSRTIFQTRKTKECHEGNL